jgi:hypothetical protein
MSRLIRSALAFVTFSLTNASSSFALDFWQPQSVCYGQTVGGDDETLFHYDSRSFSVQQAV